MSIANVYTFRFGNNRLTYRKFGNGPAVLLAFHGFGQDNHAFYPLEKTLGSQFTIYAIDLFFHGNSQYADNQLLTKTYWQQIVMAFLQSHRIERFSLVGFSLGGRLALAAIEAFADRVDQLILIAPDGITRSFWYQLATGSGAGRSLFKYVLNHLSLLNRFGYVLIRLGLLNRAVARFAQLSLATPQQREQIYITWTQFRLIHPNLATISNLLNQHVVRVSFFTGKFDQIIPGAYILPLTDKLQDYELTVLKTGHNRLIELAGEQL